MFKYKAGIKIRCLQIYSISLYYEDLQEHITLTGYEFNKLYRCCNYENVFSIVLCG